MEINKRDQELLAMGAKMKTLEEQHHDYQRHIAVLKESLVAKEEHQNMLQADVSVSHCSFLFRSRIDLENLAFKETAYEISLKVLQIYRCLTNKRKIT